MPIHTQLQSCLDGYNLKEEKYGFSFNKVIAERKAFLSRKTLEYSGKVQIDNEKKEIVFSDMLKESGSGLSMDSGVGFSATTYSSGLKGKSGDIAEQSKLFGKKYDYSFNYADLREKMEKISKEEGYTFKYSIF
jgi:hypothetical protein